MHLICKITLTNFLFVLVLEKEHIDHILELHKKCPPLHKPGDKESKNHLHNIIRTCLSISFFVRQSNSNTRKNRLLFQGLYAETRQIP